MNKKSLKKAQHIDKEASFKLEKKLERDLFFKKLNIKDNSAFEKKSSYIKKNKLFDGSWNSVQEKKLINTFNFEKHSNPYSFEHYLD